MTSSVYLALRVRASPERAFEAFTRDIAQWWRPDPLFRLTDQGDGSLAFEPGPGGRLVTRLPDGALFEIGRISVWEPGRRLVFSWRMERFGPDLTTLVEVRFEPVEDGARISIEHRGWDDIPRGHVARHGFPLEATLARVADWWRSSLRAIQPGAG